MINLGCIESVSGYKRVLCKSPFNGGVLRKVSAEISKLPYGAIFWRGKIEFWQIYGNPSKFHLLIFPQAIQLSIIIVVNPSIFSQSNILKLCNDQKSPPKYCTIWWLSPDHVHTNKNYAAWVCYVCIAKIYYSNRSRAQPLPKWSKYF